MKQKVVIADSDEHCRTKLVEALEVCDEFEVIGIAEDDVQFIKILETKQPDILVLDLLSIGLCGKYAIMEAIQSSSNMPVVVLVSEFLDEYLGERVRDWEPRCIMLKPINLSRFVKRMQEIADKSATPLYDPGVPKRRRGCTVDYHNIITESKFKSLLTWTLNNQEYDTELIRNLFWGILAAVELDCIADLQDKKLDAEMTKEHYLGYVQIANEAMKVTGPKMDDLLAFIDRMNDRCLAN